MDSLKDVESAIEDVERSIQEEDSEGKGDFELLASGGYNDVWLINRPLENTQRYVLRIPKTEDALLPDQLRNEVAWLAYVKQKLSNVPVPKVYYHSLEQDGAAPGTLFMAEEFIEGQCLSSVWKSFDEATKMSVARQIAAIVVEIGGTTFEGIGGLMLNHTLGPTVEGVKIFKGRDKFHSSTYYDIGPYKTTKDYVLACYDKEIYYYTHASEEDIDETFFEEVPLKDFVESLQAERKTIAEDDAAFSPDEPFVLVHGDLHGRNIMVKDGSIVAILDWEFAGVYPLSELLGGVGVDVLEMETEEDVDENNKWSDVIVNLAGEVAKSKDWDERQLALLLSVGNPELQKARIEMMP